MTGRNSESVISNSAKHIFECLNGYGIVEDVPSALKLTMIIDENQFLIFLIVILIDPVFITERLLKF